MSPEPAKGPRLEGRATTRVHRAPRAQRVRRQLVGLAFVAPALVLILAFIVYPMYSDVRLSLTNENLLIPTPQFVGLATYGQLLHDPTFLLAARHTISWVVLVVTLSLVGGYVFGMLLSTGFRGSSVILSLLLTVWVMPEVVSAVAWKWMFNPELGVIPYLLGHLGVHVLPLSYNDALFSLAFVLAWRLTPLVVLLVYTAVRSLPTGLFEASEIDGASWLSQVRYISTPLLRYPLVVGALLMGIYTLQDFTTIWVITQGGPVQASEILPTMIYRYGFQNFAFGTSAAASFLYLVVILIVALAYLVVLRPLAPE